MTNRPPTEETTIEPTERDVVGGAARSATAADEVAVPKSQPVVSQGKYANTVPTRMIPSGGFWSTLREFFRGGQVREPDHPLPLDPVDLRRALPGREQGLSVTWIGHSTVLVEIDGVSVLFDPVFADDISPAPLLYSARRFQERPPIRVDELPEIDLVVLTHDHYDHLDKEAVRRLARRARKFFTTVGVGDRLVKWGLPPDKVVEMTWWEERVFENARGRSLTVTCAPARHFSGRGLRDRNRTLWASFAVAGSAHKIFHSGDSGYGPHFAEIGQHLGPFDLTFMENGQYNQRWASIHMAPEETVQAQLDLRGEVMLPIHWGSFNLSLHDWWEPITRSQRAAARAGVTMLTPRVGQTVALNRDEAGVLQFPSTAAWWLDHIPAERAEEARAAMSLPADSLRPEPETN